jgi:Tfp pilus assembly protein PilX
MSIFFTEKNGYRDPTGFFYLALVAAVVAILYGIVMAFLWISYSYLPSRRLARAEIEKRILVEQARAERDSAVFEAEGEVNRAKGVAEANEIVNESLTPEYLRYHYINTLSKNNQDVIYIPTEAGLPLLEARDARP